MVIKLESRVLVLCSLECDHVDRRGLGDVIKGDDDGPSVLGDGWGEFMVSPMRRR